ncbi:MAG: hypothetical protein IKN73_02645 [Alphaproteobacteria bacterium]|nr:hypothetical protein [Alphaproteobacteria bacterium]
MKKIIFVCFVILSGCALTMQSHLDNIQKDFASGKFEISKMDVKKQSNLDLLINGNALFHANKFKESDETFEEFNKRNLSETSSSLTRETTGLLFGQSVNSYKPYMMDSLFVSYYQIWDLLALQDWANARVVINQSYERQKNMSVEYQKLIEKNKKIIAEKKEYKEILDKNSGDWLAFSDIMNPALMYLSGIYFLNDGDFDNAITYLKRANGMMPDNDFIKQDLNLALSHKKPIGIDWEFIETGFAPRLHERHSDIFLPSIGVIYFSFSEPVFNKNVQFPKNSQLLANVDAMFMTEYNEYRINEMLRSYTNAVSKTALQATAYNSNNKNSLGFGLLSSVYSVASSNADVRTWATLPQYIYVKRNENKNSKTNNLIYTRQNGTITDNKTIKLK